MRRALLFFCSLFAAYSIAHAHIQPPITEYIQGSESVCVVRVTSIDKNTVTFTIEEVIKGKPPTILKLAPVFENYPLYSEWLLASTRAKQDSVGWALKGDYGWVDAPVQRVQGKIHLVGLYGRVDPKLAADPTKGLDLDQLRALAQKPDPKN